MPSRVTVVDYGCGNLLSVSRALEHCGATVTTTSDPDEIASADRVVLPGVGAFGRAMEELSGRGLDGALAEFTRRGAPFLGICLGMQLMLGESEEFGRNAGLAMIPGRVVPVPRTTSENLPHKIPHIGWSPIRRSGGDADFDDALLNGVEPESEVYFVHSYVARPDREGDVLAETDYDGQRLAAVISSGSLFGCQFHPEKSGPAGLKILRNFLAII